MVQCTIHDSLFPFSPFSVRAIVPLHVHIQRFRSAHTLSVYRSVVAQHQHHRDFVCVLNAHTHFNGSSFPLVVPAVYLVFHGQNTHTPDERRKYFIIICLSFFRSGLPHHISTVRRKTQFRFSSFHLELLFFFLGAVFDAYCDGSRNEQCR